MPRQTRPLLAPLDNADLPTAVLHDEFAQQSISNLQAAARPMRAQPKRPRRPRTKVAQQPPANETFVNAFIEFYPEPAGAKLGDPRHGVSAKTVPQLALFPVRIRLEPSEATAL